MSLMDQILDLSMRDAKTLPKRPLFLAQLSLFDWIVCGIGGLNEPVSQKVLSYIGESGGVERAVTFGGSRFPPAAAALANGTISHALDYDDTHFAHIGHLSVGILPAALAAGQDTGASLDEVVDAFLVGAEGAIRVGLALGPVHYERGFHQTATAGAFGATLAASRLYGLSRDECRAALGLCATRASGLKSQFGTMGKPLNAGFAAANGVECARLAALGMTSADDGLEGQQGFIETHSDAPASSLDSEHFLFEDIRYKLHACCHGTHAMIEALLDIRKQGNIGADDILELRVSVHPRWLRVCDVKQPRTGLEVKFSYAWLAAMVMNDISCADPDAFGDELCWNLTLKDFAERVTVEGNEDLADTSAEVSAELRDGSKLIGSHDLMRAIDPEDLASRLREKGLAMIGDKAAALWSHVFERGRQSSRELPDLS